MILYFADIEFEEVAMSWQKMSGATRDGLVVFGSMVAVTLVVAIWAAFIRKKKRRRAHHSHGHSHNSEREKAAAPEEPQRRKWRRRRREHRPRNPTLAETGGLPPVRPPDAGA
jgi:hypothetical protein